MSVIEIIKPENIKCSECSSKDWLVVNESYFLLNVDLALSISIIMPYINSIISGTSTSGTISTSYQGVKIYQCKTCNHLKFYEDLNTNQLIDECIQKFESQFGVDLSFLIAKSSS